MARVAGAALASILSAACSSFATFPDDQPLEEATLLPLHVEVRVADSLFLECGEGAPVDSAWHWIASSSLLRLESDGAAGVSVLAEDRPLSRTGPHRCGDGGHEAGITRPGRYGVDEDGAMRFAWDSVPAPDTMGVWVTSDEVWLASAIPAGGRELSTTLRFQGTEALARLRFPVLPGG